MNTFNLIQQKIKQINDYKNRDKTRYKPSEYPDYDDDTVLKEIIDIIQGLGYDKYYTITNSVLFYNIIKDQIENHSRSPFIPIQEHYIFVPTHKTFLIDEMAIPILIFVETTKINVEQLSFENT